MKILRVIATVDPRAGGPVEGLRQSARFHREGGHETTVVSCDPPESRTTEEEPFTCQPLGPGRYGWAFSSTLRPWLEENLPRFDLVIVHGLWLYPSHAATQAYRRLQAKGMALPPLYVFSHGMLDPWFQSWRRRPVKTLRNVLYWKLVEHRVIAGATGVLFTSDEERRLARLPFRPYRPAQERVMPYGTSTPPPRGPELDQAFRERCPGLSVDQPYFLFLSRLHPKKGTDLLVEAYLDQLAQSEAPASFPDLVVAGPEQDERFCAQLRERASAAAGRIHFPGMLSGEAKWGAYYGCEAFILPSHQENFGIVVAEALGCGRPVLISDKVNIWREIDQTGAGVVEPDTAEGVARLFQRWLALDRATDHAHMADNAVKLFQAQYNGQRAAEALLELARR